MFIKTSNKTVKKVLTPEEFGANPYMKPLDGRLEMGVNFPTITYTPLGNGTTRITSSVSNVFTDEDLNKSFCGLYANYNESIPEGDPIDSFAPNKISSRYSTVIQVENAENIIVDFQYSGDDKSNTNQSFTGKGYIFFDNSAALNNTFNSYYNDLDNEGKRYIVFKSLATSNYKLICYVAPELDEIQVKSKDLYALTSNSMNARIKFGIEDYYWYEAYYGGNTKFIQPQTLINLQDTKCTFVFNNVQICPPHRFLKGSQNFTRKILSLASNIEGITAFINFNNYAEMQSLIDGGNFDKEHFQLQAGSAGKGGEYTNEDDSLLDDVKNFHYQYFNNFTFKGDSAAGSMNSSGKGGGTFFILDKGLCDFYPESDFKNSSLETKIKISQNKAGLNSSFSNPGYHDNVLEIDDPTGQGNYFATSAMGGENRHNAAVIKRDGVDEAFLFLLTQSRGNPWWGFYDNFYVDPLNRVPWYSIGGAISQPPFSSIRHNMIQDIPVVGNIYTVSKHYAKTSNLNANNVFEVQTEYQNSIRTSVCWTTVLGKTSGNIDITTEIPINGKPIELQCGDEFKIVGDSTNTVYKVIGKNRGSWSSFAMEARIDGSHSIGYLYFYLTLDKNLPSDLPLTFEIEIIVSTSQVLLDGIARDARILYKGIYAYGGLNKSTSFNAEILSTPDISGHMAYTQAEITKYFRDVDFNNGFWRENTGSHQAPSYSVDGSNVLPIRYYPKGVWLINCKNRMRGGTSFSWMGSGISKIAYENQRKIYEQENYIPNYVETEGIQHPPKYRIYNTPNAVGTSLNNPDYSVEQYDTDTNAPDLPKPILDITKKLKQ